MAENFTIEFTGNDSYRDLILSSAHRKLLGEYIYVGIFVYDGSDKGVLYAQNVRAEVRGVVYKEDDDWLDGDGWIGMVISNNIQTVKCYSFKSQESS